MYILPSLFVLDVQHISIQFIFRCEIILKDNSYFNINPQNDDREIVIFFLLKYT